MLIVLLLINSTSKINLNCTYTSPLPTSYQFFNSTPTPLTLYDGVWIYHCQVCTNDYQSLQQSSQLSTTPMLAYVLTPDPFLIMTVSLLRWKIVVSGYDCVTV